MPIVVHHLEYSRSIRVLWLLEELGLDYEVRKYQRDADFRAPPELKNIHPLGRSPVVEIDSHVLAESGAIIEYLVEREGKLKPETEQDTLAYQFFLHYAEGSAMPPLLVQLITDKLRSRPMPFFVRPIARSTADKIESNFSGPAIQLHFDFVESQLQKRLYMAGDEFSAADIQMFYAVEAALERGKGSWPKLHEWRARVTSRRAYQRAVEKGGPALPPAQSS